MSLRLLHRVNPCPAEPKVLTIAPTDFDWLTLPKFFTLLNWNSLQTTASNLTKVAESSPNG